jgi:RNA polymerase-binding transcription factor DksA
MKRIQERLEEELQGAVNRLRRIDGAVALEDFPGVIGDNSPFADEVDEIQANEGREIGFATRTLLVERVHKLRNALEHLRDGDYGTCIECGEPIAAARLRAMPEVETCVRCQDRIERYGRQLETVEVEAGVGEDDE